MAAKPRHENQITSSEADEFVDRPIGMSTLARILGVSTSTINQSPVGFQSGWTLRQCLRALNEHRRAEVSGHTMELAEERAALARAQRERIEMDLAVKRGELVPVAELGRALADAVSVAVSHLEAIPARCRMRDPTMTVGQVAVIEEEIAKSRAAIAAAKMGGRA